MRFVHSRAWVILAMLFLTASPRHFLSLGSEVVPPKAYSVLATAAARTNPPQIELAWPVDTNATSYAVSRMPFGSDTWVLLETIDGARTNYSDTTVSPSNRYEYQIVKNTAAHYTGYGYLCAGIEAPLLDQPGKIILLIANTFATDLATELAQLQQDLLGDGWTVLRHDVSSTDTVETVKALIKGDYDADPDHVKAAFLFGAIPVPYSGAIDPDGHTNHLGAWPADVYYAELHGVWTDSLVTETNAEQKRTWNLPGDGKFDQSQPPGEVNLEIGRVDLSHMTCYSNKTPPRSELDLLRQYLVKDHSFRHGLLPVDRRALICDNFTDKGSDPVGGSGWRNFSGFFGPDQIVEAGWSNYFPTATKETFLWSFASGGGQFYSCAGVGSSDDFALHDTQVVFTMWLGSHFGDWDNESNFLRAPLGSTSYTLTASYSGFPQWLYHPMALGETAGYCARLTQNNRPGGLYPPFNQGTNQVHIALLGDPTLRMHPVLPPSRLAITNDASGVHLLWSRSSDTHLFGYHIYRASTPNGPFERITGDLPTPESHFDDRPPSGESTYMVRAVKLETSSSGSYFNASQGVFGTIHVPDQTNQLSMKIMLAEAGQIHIQVQGAPGVEAVIEISFDLSSWDEMALVKLDSAGGFDSVNPIEKKGSPAFFRARERAPSD